MKQDVTYGEALEAAKQGKRISRKGWNGKGMFVFYQGECSIPHDAITFIPSISGPVREFLHSKSKNLTSLPYLCMWSAQGEIVNGWLASQTDMLSNDWCILD